MAIRRILINTPDVARSADFYRRFLGAEPLGEATPERAELDVVTAVIELRLLAAPAESSWVPDDLVTGFRHVGFKVADVDALVAPLKAAGVPFHLDPLEAEGGVRIAFFFAPEGTLLEFVARDLQYHAVHDEDGVARERALGVPERPRFDHVAVTVADRAASEALYAPFGFTRIGTIEQPHDARGFHIDYLKSGDSVLEVFTYDVPKVHRAPRLDESGFLAAVIDAPNGAAAGGLDGATELGEAAGERIVADADGFAFALVPERLDAR
jgi:catechol 2,3-dioxygenase-like lactoylglutathione lyase family enzyme